MCQAGGEWHLVGVSAWRKGCSSATARLRPRLYDRVAAAARWAKKTMEEMDKVSGTRTDLGRTFRAVICTFVFIGDGGEEENEDTQEKDREGEGMREKKEKDEEG